MLKTIAELAFVNLAVGEAQHSLTVFLPILPIPCVCLPARPHVCALPVWLPSKKFTLINCSILPLALSFAVHEAALELPRVYLILLGDYLCALATGFIILPVALIVGAIRVCVAARTFGLSADEVAFVDVELGVDLASKAVRFVLIEMAFVEAALVVLDESFRSLSIALPVTRSRCSVLQALIHPPR